MKTARLGAAIVLLLFVGATVGLLIAQEVSQPRTGIAADDGSPGPASETLAAEPGPSLGGSIPEPSSAGELASTADLANTATPDTEASEAEPPVSTSETAAEATCAVDAIYFHNTFRCATCLKIEREAKAVVEAEFADELAAGTLRWSAINMEDERRYVEQYDLVQPTLILARNVDDEAGDWVALDDTWTLIRYETRFAVYVANGVRAFLEGCP
jgi:hypothetical protein